MCDTAEPTERLRVRIEDLLLHEASISHDAAITRFHVAHSRLTCFIAR